ncbi:MAG: nuclear transport factor 2 family protein [Bacteroidota bacterium]
MHQTISICILSCLLFLACSPADNTYDATVLEGEIHQRLSDFDHLLNAGNAGGLEDFYSDDSRFYWVEDGIIRYPDKQQLTTSMQQFYGMMKSADIQVGEKRIDVLDATTAMIYVPSRQDIELNSGYQFSIDGAMSVLMKKEEGSWRFLMGHSSVKKPRGE